MEKEERAIQDSVKIGNRTILVKKKIDWPLASPITESEDITEENNWKRAHWNEQKRERYFKINHIVLHWG